MNSPNSDNEKPNLSSSTISLSYQFETLKQQHPARYRLLGDSYLRWAVEAIVAKYPAPPDVPRGNKPFLRRGRSASTSRDVSVAPEHEEGAPITYPESWLHGNSTKHALQVAIVQYRRELEDFLNSDYFEAWTLAHHFQPRQELRSIEAEPPSKQLPTAAPSSEEPLGIAATGPGQPTPDPPSIEELTPEPSIPSNKGPGFQSLAAPQYTRWRESSHIGSTSTSPSTGETPQKPKVQLPPKPEYTPSTSEQESPTTPTSHDMASSDRGESSQAPYQGMTDSSQQHPVAAGKQPERRTTFAPAAATFGQAGLYPPQLGLGGSHNDGGASAGAGIHRGDNPSFTGFGNAPTNPGINMQGHQPSSFNVFGQGSSNMDRRNQDSAQGGPQWFSQETVAAMIDSAVAKALAANQQNANNNNGRSTTAGAAPPTNDPPGPGPGSATGAPHQGNGGSKPFRAGDIGLFWPDAEEAYGAGDVIYAHKEMIYRDVYVWSRRIEDEARLKGDDLLRRNIADCFRGSALNWWLKTLSEDERISYTELDTGLKRLLSRLREKFKLPISTALAKLTEQAFSMSDAKIRKDPASYVQHVSQLAEQAGIVDEAAQCTWAWNNLDVDLQVSVPPPKPGTSIREFSDELEERKELFYKMAQAQESQREVHKRETRKEIRDKTQDYREGQAPDRSRDKGQGGRNQGLYNSQPRPQGQQQQQPYREYGNTGRPPYMGSLPPRIPYNRYPYGYQQPAYPMYNPQQFTYALPQQDIPAVGYQRPPQAPVQPQPPPQREPHPQQQQGQGQPARRELPAPRQPLMITAGNAQPNQRMNYQRPYQNTYQQRPYFPTMNQMQGYNTNMSSMGPPTSNVPVYYADNWGDESSATYPMNEEQGHAPENIPAQEVHHLSQEEHYQDAQESQAGMAEEGDYSYNEEVHQFFGDVQLTFHAGATKVGEVPACLKCGKEFTSGNALWSHIKEEGHWSKKRSSGKKGRTREVKKEVPSTDTNDKPSTSHAPPKVGGFTIDPLLLPVIESGTPKPKGTGLAFRSWHFLTTRVSFAVDQEAEPICADTGCGMTLIDRRFLKARLSNAQIQTHSGTVTLRGIGADRHNTNEFLILPFFMRGLDSKGREVFIKLTHEVHVVDNLKANMLLGMDIIGPERVVIDIPRKKLIFRSCNDVEIDCEPTARDNTRLRRVVMSSKNQVIPPHTTTVVSATLRGKTPLPERDFYFEPEIEGGYAHFVDSKADFVLVRNNTNKPMSISNKQRLGIVTEHDNEEVHHISPDEHEFSAEPDGALRENRTPVSSMARMNSTTEEAKKRKTQSYSSISKGEVDASLETSLPNGITVYGPPEHVKLILDVVNKHSRLWEDTGETVDLPPDEHMRVPLTTDWQSSSAKLGHRVYPQGPDAKKLIDEKFDKLHKDGKMSWSRLPTPFAFPVFVVYKTVYVGPDKIPHKKGRVVVDIRGLNKISVSDSYPLPVQEEIICLLRGCKYITVVDGSGMFHLFSVYYQDCHKFTVISHRGAECFNVAPMGYKGSVPYVQRKMDEMLRVCKDFARCYIDDIVIFSHTLEEHLAHLDKVFTIFVQKRVSLEPKKSFIGYPSVTLLGRRVDALGLTTTEERVEAIKQILIPTTLKLLETYIGLSNYLRKNVAYYAQIVEPLVRRKTELTKGGPLKKGQERKKYSQMKSFVPTEEERESFNMLQEALTSETYLVHHDPKRRTYVDIDASKYGFGVMVYHVKGDPEGNDFPRTLIEPILFLSKLLNTAEKRYWPTELEVACLVWTLRKIHHIILHSGKRPIIFTDHSATADIMKATSLSSSSADRLNLRLIRASQYVSQFDLDVRWKPGTKNVIPDALSRLLVKREAEVVEDDGVLDEICVYSYTTAQMSSKYCTRLVKAYKEDKKWSRIYSALQDEEEAEEENRSGDEADDGADGDDEEEEEGDSPLRKYSGRTKDKKEEAKEAKEDKKKGKGKGNGPTTRGKGNKKVTIEENESSAGDDKKGDRKGPNEAAATPKKGKGNKRKKAGVKEGSSGESSSSIGHVSKKHKGKKKEEGSASDSSTINYRKGYKEEGARNKDLLARNKKLQAENKALENEVKNLRRDQMEQTRIKEELTCALQQLEGKVVRLTVTGERLHAYMVQAYNAEFDEGKGKTYKKKEVEEAKEEMADMIDKELAELKKVCPATARRISKHTTDGGVRDAFKKWLTSKPEENKGLDEGDKPLGRNGQVV